MGLEIDTICYLEDRKSLIENVSSYIACTFILLRRVPEIRLKETIPKESLALVPFWAYKLKLRLKLMVLTSMDVSAEYAVINLCRSVDYHD